MRRLHVCWHCLHQCALANTGHAKMAHSLPQVMLFTPALNAFSRAVPDEKVRAVLGLDSGGALCSFVQRESPDIEDDGNNNTSIEKT